MSNERDAEILIKARLLTLNIASMKRLFRKDYKIITIGTCSSLHIRLSRFTA